MGRDRTECRRNDSRERGVREKREREGRERGKNEQKISSAKKLMIFLHPLQLLIRSGPDILSSAPANKITRISFSTISS